MDLLIAGKEFDITAYHQRYIGLEILYVGWQYMGSTYQPKEENTVEANQSAPQLYGRLPLPRKLPKNTRAYYSGISLLFFALSCGISRLVIEWAERFKGGEDPLQDTAYNSGETDGGIEAGSTGG